MTRLLITRRVREWLAGTGAGQAVSWWTHGGPLPAGEDDETMALACKILLADLTRKDRAVWVDLDSGEVETLRIYLEAMEASGRDNSWDADGRADAAASSALLRKIEAAQ